jgi:hypothetical protein
VKIYLLLLDHERFFFYADVSASPREVGAGPAAGAVPRSGLRGWLHARYQKLVAEWQYGESGAIVWVRRAWEWLHSLAHPDEAMLARLRGARSIDLHYPATHSSVEVREIWRDYLWYQWWRHLLWFAVNGAVAPPAIAILWILPGPNLIGYWFLYRAIHHALVLWGIRRVMRNQFPTEFIPLGALDVPIERDGSGQPVHEALGEKTARLAEHVDWHLAARRARRRNRLRQFAPPAKSPPDAAPRESTQDL